LGLYTKLAANVVFPIHEKVKGHTTIDVFKAMEQSQWLSVAQLQQLQIDRLKLFLETIGETVPYYRELFTRYRFDPASVSSVDDLNVLPFLGKPEIRANMDSLTADGARGLQRFNTGGSSGEPLIFYLGKERVSHDVAAKRRATRWWGVDIGDPEIVIWGSPIELGSQDRIKKLRDKLFRTELLSAFEMSESMLDAFIARIIDTSPKMLFGYPSALAFIAQHADKRDIRLDRLGIEVAFVTSEMLLPEQRIDIEKCFGCPVANGYGGRDAGFIAHECPAGNMHITSEDIVVEVVNEAGKNVGKGEEGEFVITHLATSEFPFVRYRTGDIGALSEDQCSCGRGLPILEKIQGRSTDFLVAQDGTRLHGLSLIYVLRDVNGIESFKIIQESVALTRVELVVDETFSVKAEESIGEQFRRRLGIATSVQFDYVTTISAEKSGKFRYVVSRVIDKEIA
jgi:phenylacetate-coenzyme A ligase PaaK-like adenylate-forming protein